jgi:hypothetical protein
LLLVSQQAGEFIMAFVVVLSSQQWQLFSSSMAVPRRLFFAALQRIAITLSPKYYQKNQSFITRKNQEEHGPDVM